MLSCVVGKTKVNVVDYSDEELRKWSKKGILKCPVCNDQMIYKHGFIKVAHFAHKSNDKCDYVWWENETKEHHLGKVHLYKWLKQLDGIGNLELESYIPETKQRPDLYFELNDKRYVIEYQCTPITIKEFHERRELYRLNEIIDIWVLGVERFSFNPEDPKFRLKALEKELFNLNRYYRLNPFTEEISQVFISNIKKYSLFTHSVVDYNVFYIHKTEIILGERINKLFYGQLNQYKKRIISRQERIKRLISEQQKVYSKMVAEEEKIQAKLKEQQRIYDIVGNKNIYIYSSIKKIKTLSKAEDFSYLHYKGNIICSEWLLNEVLSFNCNKDDIHILLSNWAFGKKMKTMLHQTFRYNNKLFFRLGAE